MTEIILHHYPQSPFSEKVRVILGMKRLAWRSVHVPRLPPKPDLTSLTGGYRRAPVMQIGADIYCDTQCIARELERRFPRPSLFPGGDAGMPWALSRWTDGPLFVQTAAVVLGAQADELPEDFAADRGRLYFGPDYDLHAFKRDLPHLLVQLRAQLGWIDQRLATGRDFILGDTPGLPDALCYYLVWFIRGRYADAASLLGRFPALTAWEQRVKALGHGSPSEMSAERALDMARGSRPVTAALSDADDPQDLALGAKVGVTPDGIGGDSTVHGEVASFDAEHIAIRRDDPRVGEVVVHFPRVGYRVSFPGQEAH